MTACQGRRGIGLGRCGVTLVELLVVMGALSILVSLLLPAVQRSREASRRALCANNLRQLIQSAMGFESTHGGFPMVGWAGVRSIRSPAVYNASSPQCALLPYLEQRAVFDAINFDVTCCGPLESIANVGNATVAARVINVFLCPSDPQARGGAMPYAPISYRANAGLGEFRVVAPNTYAWIFDGAFQALQPVLPLATFQDGLSGTLAFAEKPVGSGPSGPYHPFRDYYNQGFAITADDWVRVCANAPIRVSISSRATNAGATWLVSYCFATLFFAIQPPNDPVPDCGGLGNTGLFTARSYHPGGVNAAMCDGSVRFFQDGTAVRVWRAHGTRNRSD